MSESYKERRRWSRLVQMSRFQVVPLIRESIILLRDVTMTCNVFQFKINICVKSSPKISFFFFVKMADCDAARLKGDSGVLRSEVGIKTGLSSGTLWTAPWC